MNSRQIPSIYYYTPKQQPPRRHRNKSKRWNSGLILLLVVFGLFGWWAFNKLSNNTSTAASSGSSQEAALITEQPKEPEIPKTSLEEMETEINRIINEAADVIDISVAIIDLKTDKLYHYGVANSTVFTGASVGKLITATAFLSGVEQGRFSLNQTIADTSAASNLRAMIVNSDNDAWHALNKIITLEGLETYAADAIGITNYSSEDNTFSPDDIAKLEQLLYQGKLLNQENTSLLLDYMEQANRTDFIKPAIPTSSLINFYHKAGWLSELNHDAAIIDDGKNPYVLVIFTKARVSNPGVTPAAKMQAIATATIGHFISRELAYPTTASTVTE